MIRDNFLIINSTSKSVKEVIDQLETLLQQKNVTIFARIDHSQAAKNVGLTLQDEELLIFGNPKVGTALMIENPAIGIELPLKILAWQEDQKTLVAYHNLEKLYSLFDINTSINATSMLKTFMENLIGEVIK